MFGLDLSLLSVLGVLVVLAPVALVAVLGVPSLIGRPLSERTTARAVDTAISIGLLATGGVFLHMLAGDTRHIVFEFGNWVHVENPPPEPPFHFAVKFVFDRLSIPFTALTFGLCGVIGRFATRYMHRERGYNRFFTLYSLFLAGMVIAATAGTIEMLFLGWELVGLSSALLIGYFHERPAPMRNALRVWVVYRASDAALLLAAVVLHHTLGEGDLDTLTGYRESADETSWPFGTCPLAPGPRLAVGILLILAAAGKSALVPFSGWLPRAMEGPTPSSAVFYGALSVHLGAYLLLRTGPVLDASPLLSGAVVVLGLTTAGFAALAGRVQTDIKSVLSFASLTQVGLIVAEIGLGWRYIPLVHLLGHACLRTLQFLRAPNVLQDYRTLENALGNRPSTPRVLGGAWLYQFALERGHLDAILDRYIAGPFVAVFRGFNRLEHRWSEVLAGRPTPPVEPAPAQTEPMEQTV